MPKLNKEEILARTDKGLDVFRHYLPGNWRLGKNFLNPFYADTKPSCNIYYDSRSGCFKMKDFGNDDYSGDCFYFVSKIFGLNCRSSQDFMRILGIVNDDMHLGLEQEQVSVRPVAVREIKPVQTNTYIGPSVPSVQASHPPFRYECQPFTTQELAWWGQYGIGPDTLHRFHVVSIREYTSWNKNHHPFTLRSSPEMPIFGYEQPEGIKIYRPKATEMRFMYGGHCGNPYCFGFEQLPPRSNSLFITGGEKDVMSLSAKGFSAICFGSENCHIPKMMIEKILVAGEVKYCYLLFDMDAEGVKSSKRHEESLKDIGVQRVELPLAGTKAEKDISDYFRMGRTVLDFLRLLPENRHQQEKELHPRIPK